MALKTDRSTLQTDISFFMNEAATRGGVVSLSTGGSGAAMDQGAALVTYAAHHLVKLRLVFWLTIWLVLTLLVNI